MPRCTLVLEQIFISSLYIKAETFHFLLWIYYKNLTQKCISFDYTSTNKFLAAIAAQYLGSLLTDSLTGAELGQNYKLVKTTM